MGREGEGGLKVEAKALSFLGRAVSLTERESMQRGEGLGGKARSSVLALLGFRWQRALQVEMLFIQASRGVGLETRRIAECCQRGGDIEKTRDFMRSPRDS